MSLITATQMISCHMGNDNLTGFRGMWPRAIKFESVLGSGFRRFNLAGFLMLSHFYCAQYTWNVHECTRASLEKHVNWNQPRTLLMFSGHCYKCHKPHALNTLDAFKHILAVLCRCQLEL